MRVLLFGTFDHLHPGHAFVLSEGLKRGEVHVIVAQDATVQRIKGKLPRQSQEERMDAIRKYSPEIHVVLGDLKNYLIPVREIAPDLILLGYDQHLPPGVSMEDFHCPVERLPAFKEAKYKSSLRRENEEKQGKHRIV